jgi:predicted nucleic acid-binding protein
MIVVSNTSPLTNLAAIGQFDLLRLVFGQIHVPARVREELNAEGTAWPGSREVAGAEWVVRHEADESHIYRDLCADLGVGEASSIALGLRLNADLVLLDEKEGRHRARLLGLRPMGVCGILLAAKSQGHISAVRPHLDALRTQAGFRLHQSVYESVLALASEG